MSTFRVDPIQIAEIHPHPNADRLEVAAFRDFGYTLVVQKESFQQGKKILYIPLDAVLPDDIIEELGVRKYLTGPNSNIVQTAVLRGVASQGLPAPLSLLTNRGIPEDCPDIAAALGITKYDPEPKEAENAYLLPLPGNRHSYDIENAERLAKVVAYIIENKIEVVITEKLEGCHIGVYCDSQGPTKFIHNNSIFEEEGKTNPICELMRKTGLIDQASDIFSELGHPISLHAEALGPGSGRDYYQLGLPQAPIFDIGIQYPSGWTYLSEDEILLLGGNVLFPRAHILFRGSLTDYLQGKSIVEASHGVSILNPKKLREGIVIKPAVEAQIPLELCGGRLIIKQRDPIYLSKHKLSA